jgi:hypothetical protein
MHRREWADGAMRDCPKHGLAPVFKHGECKRCVTERVRQQRAEGLRRIGKEHRPRKKPIIRRSPKPPAPPPPEPQMRHPAILPQPLAGSSIAPPPLSRLMAGK